VRAEATELISRHQGVHTVLCAKYKHETTTCGMLATITMESRRLFEANYFAVGEVNVVLKILIVAAEL
jgi:hypothetical protein